MRSAEHHSTEIAQLDRLVLSLETAEDALRAGSTDLGDTALTEALQVLGELYGALAPDRSPEATAQLEDVYDACIRALGDAYCGAGSALVPAIGVVRAIRGALGPQAPGGVIRRAA